MINKVLMLRGIGKDGAVELAGGHHTDWVVKASGGGVGLSNLTVTGFWKRRPCVVVSGGEVSIEGCRITGGVRLESGASGEVR